MTAFSVPSADFISIVRCFGVSRVEFDSDADKDDAGIDAGDDAVGNIAEISE